MRPSSCRFGYGISAAMSLCNSMRNRALAGIVPDVQFSLTYSLGVAAYPTHANDNKSLIRIAFEKMFEARDGGGNRICHASN